MKTKFVLLLIFNFCFFTISKSQAGSNTKAIPSVQNIHSGFVIRYATEEQLKDPQLPSGSIIQNVHEPLNSLVVTNDRFNDETFSQLLSEIRGAVRVEKSYYDAAGQPIYPTGIAILEPVAGSEKNSREFCRITGCIPMREMNGLGWFSVLIPKEVSFIEFEAAARETGLFNLIMRDEIILAHINSNDPLYANCWYVYQSNDRDIDADGAWDILPSNSSVKNVAIIDGHGYDTTHPDMIGNWADTYNAVNQTTNVTPQSTYERHATSCAGIPGAEYNNSLGTPGLGKNLLNIQAIKIGYNIQSGGTFYTTSLIEADAINRVITNGNTVAISMSFGSTSYQSAFFNAITAARTNGRNGKGIMVFASTGNSGITTWTNYPASYSGVIAVGSTTANDARSGFSNYGNGLTLSAPGTGIYTIDIASAYGYNTGDYTSFSGTSAACPVAASVGAMMFVANPLLTEAQGTQILAESCEKVGGYVYADLPEHSFGSWSPELGYGRVNMLSAVASALPSGPVVPDITLSSYSADNTSVLSGQTININCTQAISDATYSSVNVSVEYWWSADQVWSSTDILIGSDLSNLGGGIVSEMESISYLVNSSAGTRYILIKCDAAGIISETNENNNIAVIPVTILSAIVLSDITIASASINNPNPYAGQSVLINCAQSIANAITETSEVFLEYRYSTNTVWSTIDLLIGRDTSSIGSLVNSESESISYTIPAGTGLRYILIKADINSTIGESNEYNNIYAIPVTVMQTPVLPEISISNVIIDNPNPFSGQTVNISCDQVISNVNISSTDVILEYWYSQDAVLNSSDTLIGSDTSALGSINTSEAENFSFVVPSETGVHYLLVKADASSLMAESNESNNIYAIALNVVTPILPNVTISAISLSSSSPEQGQVISISAQQTIANGPSVAVQVALEYWWSADAVLSTTSDILIGTDVSTLGGSISSELESVNFTIPSGTGNRYILVKADAYNATTESNESNVFSTTLTVVSSQESLIPDVFLDEVSVTANTAIAGQLITVNSYQNISIPTVNGAYVAMEYRWATTTAWSSSFPLIGTDASILGNGNADDPEAMYFFVPAGTGQYYILIKCDSGNAVAESNESNNVITIPVLVVPTLTTSGNDETSSESDGTILNDSNEFSPFNSGGNETVDDNFAEKLFSFYPNPARDVINVILRADLEQTSVYEILSITGAVLKRDFIGAGLKYCIIDISDIPTGIYFLKIVSGETMSSERLIIGN